MAKNKDIKDQNILKKLREMDQGSGVTLTMGIPGSMEHHQTKQSSDNSLPKGLRLEVSSVEGENNELLHTLLEETRKTCYLR